MRELIFIRHAETDLAGTFCGHSDPPLNPQGNAQVYELIRRLASYPFDAVHSSDLRRATSTAGLLARAASVPLITSTNLREIYFGEWEGMTWADIETRDAAYARSWIESYPRLPAPAGEHFANFETRILQKVERLLCLAADKRLAVVTHAGVMRVVLRNFLGHSEQRAWELTNTYCSFFTYAGVSR